MKEPTQKGGRKQSNDTKPIFCCERVWSRRRGGVGAGTGVGSAAVRGGDTTAFYFRARERNKITEVLLRWAVDAGYLGGVCQVRGQGSALWENLTSLGSLGGARAIFK